MRLVVAIEHRYDRTPDGAVWTTIGYAYDLWQRYLSVFDEVRVAARVRDVPAVPNGARRADGERVTFAAVPYFVGPWQYLRRAGDVRRAVRGALEAGDAVILRIPGTVGTILESCLRGAGRPFGVEVVGDPYDVFAPGSVKNIFRPFFRSWFSHVTRRQCATACAAAYVTQNALQRRYPAADDALSTHYSSIDLRDEAFALGPRPLRTDQKSFQVIHVGMLAQLYKAPDVLIDAVAICVRDGLDIRLRIAGDGKHRGELERKAVEQGVAGRVQFLGMLPDGRAVRWQLDECDLFVLASHQEGLPRAAIEAMARGLPCIGSTVGGFPELLPSEDMVQPGDARALAAKIREMLADPQRMTRASARNLRKARDYHADVLNQRRRGLYEHVRGATERWLASPPPRPT